MNELSHVPSLVACKRVLAELYNDCGNMTLELRIKILTALGYGDDQKRVGALLAGDATLSPDGEIVYKVTEAQAEDYPRARAKRSVIEPSE